jgi:hypothetical protein
MDRRTTNRKSEAAMIIATIKGVCAKDYHIQCNNRSRPLLHTQSQQWKETNEKKTLAVSAITISNRHHGLVITLYESLGRILMWRIVTEIDCWMVVSSLFGFVWFGLFVYYFQFMCASLSFVPSVVFCWSREREKDAPVFAFVFGLASPIATP